jgi:hypothetical protein
MEKFVENGYVGKDLTSLNYVRKFLKAITLADIATTNGVYISRNAFEARSGNRLREGLGWPRVPAELPQSFIMLWKEAITLCFLNPTTGGMARARSKKQDVGMVFVRERR